jgi:hypothetical protein
MADGPIGMSGGKGPPPGGNDAGEAMTEGRLEPKRCSFCGKSEQEPFNLIIIFHATPVCGICVNAMGRAMQKEQYHRTAHKGAGSMLRVIR